jgi:CBS domain-containing protein
MTTGEVVEAVVAYIGEGETLRQAGHRMRELGVSALQVRGENGELTGTISRDMVVESIAAGGDPKTVTVGQVMPFTLTPPRTRADFPVTRSKAVA